MFDIGWSELLIIGVVALIVVGPEDLPRMFHTLGRMTAKARSMAREFSSAMEDAAKQSGLQDAAKTLNDVRGLTSKTSLGLNALDKAAAKFEAWDPKLPKAVAAPRATPDPAAPAPGAEAPGPAAVSPASSVAEAPAPGARTLRAVRRSDSKDS